MREQPGSHRLSRREFLLTAAGAGVLAGTGSAMWEQDAAYAAGPGGVSSLGSGTTPEQVHLTWGSDASTAVTVSWASAAQETSAQIVISPAVGGQTVFAATTRTYIDGPSGETVFAYHVPLTGLAPSTAYSYTVSDAAAPAITFASSFTTAPTGRVAFRFTSYGDLGTPGAGATYTLADGTTVGSTAYSESQWNAYNAVGEVEALAPLFHLLNGDLCYADKQSLALPSGGVPTNSEQPAPEVWRDFGLNVQRSAANRPWMPCIGNHEAELDNGPGGYNSFKTRFALPDNGLGALSGNFYSFRVGSVLFIALDANDMCYQGGGAYNVSGAAFTDSQGHVVSATAAQYNQYYTGAFGTTNVDGTFDPAGNAQTSWLANTLAAARGDTTIDWIAVQMHQSALSSSTDNGCDAGIRQAWVPLFDKYQVDLVVSGHDHDYERSYPVRGFTPNLGTSTFAGGTVTNASGTQTLPSTKGATVNTFTPNVVSGNTTSPFNTSLGTVYLVLGGGGTNKRDNAYGKGVANVTTFTQIRTSSTKPLPDATEPAAWSAMTDTADAYGVALFSVDPGTPGGNTTITVEYLHAPTATVGPPNYTALETFTLTRPRSDGTAALLPEFFSPALAAGATVTVAGGMVYLRQRARLQSAEAG